MGRIPMMSLNGQDLYKDERQAQDDNKRVNA